MYRIIASAILLAASSQGLAQPVKMEPGPKSPAESLKCIQTRPGFTVELMAAEPLVMDPIAFAWGPDGKFWVVEMGDYPLGVDGKGKFGGKVKFLEKAKPLTPNPSPQGGERSTDGPYTKATIFLDNLGYPTGVTPWGKGVIITCAPDIFYAEDTDGDGKADKKVVLFTGFREGNQQHRVNGLVWGLDNWLYGANGDSGGVVKAVNKLVPRGNGSFDAVRVSETPNVNISGRDFRLKPETGEFEAVTGQTQFGRCRDDFGNWFGNNNTNPLYHYVLEDRYLKRNPHVLYPDARVNVSVKPGASPVFPISKGLPRFNSPNAVNHFTSACSAIIYRDDFFGPEFYGNSFVSEPVHNLIHREIVNPKGVTFTSQRADDEQTSEFLASSDNWFRPTMIAVGPDGALWIADMYRYVIEHPEWIPLTWQKKLELRAGHDLGRIYRVYPKGKSPRAIPRMDKMEGTELVKALESPNGWIRDVAQQQLVQHHASNNTVFKNLLALVRDRSKSATARIHGMGVLDEVARSRLWVHLDTLLEDTHSEVRRHAVRCSESYMFGGDLRFPGINDRLANMNKDKSALVRQQLGYTLGFRNEGGAILGRMVGAAKEDRFIVAAVLSSVHHGTWPSFFDAALRETASSESVAALIRLAAVHGKPLDVARVLSAEITSQQENGAVEQMLMLASLLDMLDQQRSSLAVLTKDTKEPRVLVQVNKILDTARTVAADPKAAAGDIALAIRLLGRGPDHLNEDRRLLGRFLTPQMPEDIQKASVQRLAGILDPRMPDQLIGPWKSLTPAVRNQVMDVLLARIEWTRLAVEALEKRRILPQEIDPIRRQKLLDHRDEEIRAAAAKLFTASWNPDRVQLVDRYSKELPTKGDVNSGSKLFAKHCAACHQLAGVGEQVGPDLAAVGDKSPLGLLIAILDPNKAVEARYVNYVATTKSGLSLSGLLHGETSTTLTLVAADGKKHDLLRKDLDELVSTGKSAMPEGFEKELPPAAMADLIAFLRGNIAKSKSFAGNRPELVKAAADGTLKLAATTAAVYGKTLIFEEKYQNLGYWSSADDQAVWTIDVPKPGRYEVWIDFACESGSAGNSCVLQIGDARLTHKVAGTASWELYRRVKIGTVRLAAGRQDAVLRAEGAIRGALLDLKEVHLLPVVGD